MCGYFAVNNEYFKFRREKLWFWLVITERLAHWKI